MHDGLFDSCRTAATNARNNELDELKNTLKEFIQ